MITRFRQLEKICCAPCFWQRRGRRRRQEEHFSGILEAAPDAMVLVDNKGRIRLLNAQMEQLFGYRREELIGQVVERLIPERFRQLHASHRAAYFKDPRVRHLGTGLKLFGLRRDGREFPADIRLSPLQTEKGIMAVAVVRDITEDKKAARYQFAQYAIAGVLAGSASMAEAAPRLLQILCECLSWELGEVWLFDARTNLLRHMESWHVANLDADEFIAVSRDGTFAPGVGFPGRVWQTGEPESVADVMGDTGFARAAIAAAAGLHGALAFPIGLGGHSLGVMVFFSRERRQPEEDLLAILITVGNQIGQFMVRKRAEEELRFSEARFRALHRDIPTMIFTLDKNGKILTVNPFGANQLGFAVEELEGQHILNIFHEEDRPAVADQMRNCLRHSNQVYRWQLRKICKDGSLLMVEELAQAVYGPEGLNILLVCQDITERRRAEEALRQQEERFRYVALATRDAIYDSDFRTGRVWRNEAYQELYSLDKPMLPEDAWWVQNIQPDDRQRIQESIQQAFIHRDSFWSGEYRFRRYDGKFASVMDRGYILYDAEGMPVRMIGAITDVTERKNALIEAEAFRDKIDAILKSVADGLLVTDLADRVLLMNEAAEALLGVSLTGASRRHIASLQAEENLWRQISEVGLGEQERAISEWEKREAGTGQARVLQAQTTAVRSADGERTGTITILRDITREREIDRVKNEFISTAAHELRTPLTTIMGYLQLLQDEERFTPEERKEFLQLVYEKSEVLDRIIRDLLDLSRVQAGKLVTIEKIPGDFTLLVRHAVAAYQGISGLHVFHLEFPEEAVEFQFDPGKIGQVLDNLFSNAVKFSPAGGNIRVIGRRTDGVFQVTVADEGIGMRPEQVAHVFDKFYRADASNTGVSGLGLGMSIVKNIIEAHGGRIWVVSRVGRGTQVHFTLMLDDGFQ